MENVQFNKTSGWFICTFKFEKHCPGAQLRRSRSMPRILCGQNGGSFGLEAGTWSQSPSPLSQGHCQGHTCVTGAENTWEEARELQDLRGSWFHAQIAQAGRYLNAPSHRLYWFGVETECWNEERMEDTDLWWSHMVSSVVAGAPQLWPHACKTYSAEHKPWNFPHILELGPWGSLTHPIFPFSNSFLSEKHADKIIFLIRWHFRWCLPCIRASLTPSPTLWLPGQPTL